MGGHCCHGLGSPRASKLLWLPYSENPPWFTVSVTVGKLVSMMDVAASKRKEQDYALKFGVILQSHFDNVEQDYQG